MLGYNYAITTPNNEEILFGFDPRNIRHNYLDIAQGWDIKLPRISEHSLITLRGYKIPIDELDIHNEQGDYILDEGYGRKTVFSPSGLIKSVVDEFDNETTYRYFNGKLTEISYADSSRVFFNRSDKGLSITYSYNNGTTIVLALFNVSSEYKLYSIEGFNDSFFFDYLNGPDSTPILLKSCELQDEYVKRFTYINYLDDKIENEYARVSMIDITYSDNITKNYHYTYNSQEQLRSVSFGNGFWIEYEYSTDKENSHTVHQVKHTPSTVSVISTTKNYAGQIIEYINNQNKVRIEYNDNNKITSIDDDGIITEYTYNNNGLLVSSITTDGIISEYSYDNRLQNEKLYLEEDVTSHSLLRRASWSVQYKINQNVGVTDFMESYGLNLGSCNCYGFSMGRYTQSIDPGTFAGKYYDTMLKDNLNTLKLAVEEDQTALGRYFFDCGVADNFTSHQWKIAMRIKSGHDYHFMEQSYQGPWMFKAGNTGPVMQLLSNQTPPRVSWDQYNYNVSTHRYQVETSAYYNSAIKYMIIEG